MTSFAIAWDRRMLLLAAGLGLTIAALIGFHLIRGQNTIDAVAIVDITGSMNTRDMGSPPGSATRLQAARSALIDLIQNVPCQSRLGLGVFTERISFLLFNPVEICNSYDGLEDALSQLDWRMAWQGDSYIAKGLYSAIDIAASLKSDLIFLTDGQEAPPLPFTGTPPFEGKSNEIKGLIVGVGGTDKVPIPKFDDEGRQIGVYGPNDVPQDNRIGAAPPGAEAREGYNPRNAPFGALPTSGDEHLSSVKTAHLQELAEKTGLTYVELKKAGSISDALIASTKARVVPTSTNMAYVPASLALLLMVLLYGLSLIGDSRFFNPSRLPRFIPSH
jgi:mxaL protein